MKTIIHVNRHFIAANQKDGGNRPVYSIKNGNKTRYAREVIIKGESRFVYDGTALKCGARCWLETNSEVELVDEMSYVDAKNVIDNTEICDIV